MKENRIKIIINKPITDIFEFTTNPKNTHLWISSIKEEVTETYPPKIGTKYKNTGDYVKWDFYEVIELQNNEIFTLADLEKNYHVKYRYKVIDEKITEMEYFEWMNDGELNNPFSDTTLKKLKLVIESL